MAEEEGGSQKRSSEQERSIAKRRDALLAEARGENKQSGALGGADPRLMGLGIQFVIAILISLYAGMWVDTKFRTTPWFTLIGGMLGAGAGFYAMYSAMKSSNKKFDDEARQKRDAQDKTK